MKKEYNELVWPYIGPKVKDGEMKIWQVAKCIGIEEKLDVYQFVVQSLASIETNWSLEKLWIIFGDQFLTKARLENPGIVQTCTLKWCDYHHIVNKACPLQCGLSLCKELKPFLACMMQKRSTSSHLILP
jgi:hypothetical protein